MKRLMTFLIAAALTIGSSAAFAQQNSGVKQDVKDAGKATGNAAKKTGKVVKKTTKKVVHAGAKTTEKGAAKVEKKTSDKK